MSRRRTRLSFAFFCCPSSSFGHIDVVGFGWKPYIGFLQRRLRKHFERTGEKESRVGVEHDLLFASLSFLIRQQSERVMSRKDRKKRDEA